jgi:hypothetical protein
MINKESNNTQQNQTKKVDFVARKISSGNKVNSNPSNHSPNNNNHQTENRLPENKLPANPNQFINADKLPFESSFKNNPDKVNTNLPYQVNKTENPSEDLNRLNSIDKAEKNEVTTQVESNTSNQKNLDFANQRNKTQFKDQNYQNRNRNNHHNHHKNNHQPRKNNEPNNKSFIAKLFAKILSFFSKNHLNKKIEDRNHETKYRGNNHRNHNHRNKNRNKIR